MRIFEVGSCFLKEEDGYAQSEKLGGLCYGGIVAEQWGSPERNTDFYDVKSDIEALFWPEIINFEITAPSCATSWKIITNSHRKKNSGVDRRASS